MSYEVYYTIRSNEKTNYEVETLFFGKQKIYDFKKVFNTEVYDTYEECLKVIYEENLINVHIRKTISTSAGVQNKDYRTAFNAVYKGNDFRKTNSYPYNMKGLNEND